jgi:hypothetical protein
VNGQWTKLVVNVNSKPSHIDWTVLRETAMCVSANEGAAEEMTTAITNSINDRVRQSLLPSSS